MSGVSVQILRSNIDCTNGGISSPARSEGKIYVVFDPAIRRGNYSLDDARNNPKIVPLVVVRRESVRGEYLHLEPMDGTPGDHAGPMFGGNYGHSPGDSRFADVSQYPLPIHDRSETWQDYDALTR